MNDWKRLFKPWILDRGFEYYMNSAVLDLAKCNGRYRACVTGSEDYEVIIEMKNKRITYMECNCPYAYDGQNCKHMAAVLYEINEGEDNDQGEEWCINDNNEDNIKEIIESLSESELKEVVREIIQNSNEAYSVFQNKYIKKIIGHTNVLKQIESIFADYSDYSDYVDYKEALELHEELDMQIDSIRMLVTDGRYQEAYTCVKYIIMQSQYLEIDDSAGYFYNDLSACMEIIREILSKETPINKTIVSWLTTVVDMPCFFFEKEVLDMLEQFEDINEFLDNKIAAMKAEGNIYCSIDLYLDKKYLYLRHHNKNVKEFVEENVQYTIVRKRYIEDLIMDKNYQEALHWLTKSRSMDIEKRGLVNEYCQGIIDIYNKLGSTKEAIIEAKKWLYKYSEGELKAFLVLKSLYKDQWLEHQQEVIKELENREVDMLDIYQEEKMYNLLLAKLMNDTTPYRMQKYEKVLKPIYPNELLKFFNKHIQLALLNSNSRKYYQGIVRQIKHLLSYPNGKQEVASLLQLLKNKYHNRPALLDELAKIKI